jgi:regulatory protein
MGSTDPPRAPRRARPKISLKAQAVGLLSRREHSRQELRVKLLAALRKRERDEAAVVAMEENEARSSARDGIGDGIDDDGMSDTGASEASTPSTSSAPLASDAVVDELLDWLAANNYLSERRFVESRINARAQKQGAAMIRHELARHGLAFEPAQATALRDTEFARAQALWQRKFGAVATQARDRAKQARFLVSRGFEPDVVRRIVAGLDED